MIYISLVGIYYHIWCYFRSTIADIAEEGPSKLKSLDDESEITFQLGLILRYVGVSVLT